MRSIAVTLLLACSCSPPPGPAEIQLGTGAETFVNLADRDSVEIIRGLQGGSHIWVSVRASKTLDPVQMRITVHALLNGAELLEPASVRINLVPKGEYSETSGLRALVPDPNSVAGRELVLKVVATDGRGNTAEDERKVIPRL